MATFELQIPRKIRDFKNTDTVKYNVFEHSTLQLQRFSFVFESQRQNLEEFYVSAVSLQLSQPPATIEQLAAASQ